MKQTIKRMERMKQSFITKATLGRLPTYLEFLKSLPESSGPHISATAIAKALDLGEVQVRKDLNSVNGSGKPKIGYTVSELISSLEEVLGSNDYCSAVIVGAGKLGAALLGYNGFRRYGIEILAAFDLDEDKLTTAENGKKVFTVDSLREFCSKEKVKMGIITVPAPQAQEVADMMVACGIKAIWNFAPTKLTLPQDILIKQENLALSLAHLSTQMSDKN